METGQTYHIYNHANGSENIFREEENYRFFLKQYKKHLADVVDTYAYCLMPNHFHFLVKVKEADVLKKNPTFEKLDSLDEIEAKASKQFANLFISYTMAFNKKYNRKGSLFMKNFKRKPIESIEQWQEAFLYIHINPIKHKFSNKIEDWNWSSWHAYNNMESRSLLARPKAIGYFDNIDNLLYCSEEKRRRILNMNLE
ncbi:transposase [Marivirga arenosa]|uniref:Transposase n=1 Tax=Marivirga arenosa TaxID=3059076 RepID=A0AA49J9Z3_9BACT|nr:transposase [Marivirga sp. BKB1-2]WKK79240.1 transposase [Marivirga sp. BKB1-2]